MNKESTKTLITALELGGLGSLDKDDVQDHLQFLLELLDEFEDVQEIIRLKSK